MFKRILPFLIAAVIIASCTTEKANMTVLGTVKGLKKGTLYLQKIQDTSLIVIDSIVVNGDPDFLFSTYLESPEMLYLYLDKKDGNDLNDRIAFFAEPGEIRINTRFDLFDSEYKVSGSSLQDKYEIYKQMMSRFNQKDLELAKANIEARRDEDSVKLGEIIKETNSLFKRRYLYAVNFAMNNKETELAPYIALTEIFDANVTYLDTINNSLTEKVKSSKYGKALDKFIKDRKETDIKE